MDSFRASARRSATKIGRTAEESEPASERELNDLFTKRLINH